MVFFHFFFLTRATLSFASHRGLLISLERILLLERARNFGIF